MSVLSPFFRRLSVHRTASFLSGWWEKFVQAVSCPCLAFGVSLPALVSVWKKPQKCNERNFSRDQTCISWFFWFIQGWTTASNSGVSVSSLHNKLLEHAKHPAITNPEKILLSFIAIPLLSMYIVPEIFTELCSLFTCNTDS